MSDFNWLPNEMWQQILIRLPRNEFIRVVPLVSRDWAALRNDATRFYHRLYLAINQDIDPNIDQPEVFLVRLHRNLTPEAARAMTSLFRSIRELVVAMPDAMPPLMPMLESWSETLTTLNVSINRPVDVDGIEVVHIDDELLDVINTRLPGLRDLTFEDHRAIYTNDNEQLDLPVLSRLNVFQFSTGNPIEDLFDSLHRYAIGNTQLNSIRIFNRIGSHRVFQQLSEEFPPEVSVCTEKISLYLVLIFLSSYLSYSLDLKC